MACKSDVPEIYNDIIEDVASNVRSMFAEEGVDEDVLHELIALWKSKLMASNAADLSEDIPQPSESQLANPTEVHPQQQTSNQVQADTDEEEVEMVSVEITLPTQSTENAPTRTLTIQVPFSCFDESVLNNLSSIPIITTIIGVPDAAAAKMLQRYIQDLLQSHQQQKLVKKVAVPQVVGSSGTKKKRKKSKTDITEQTDGASDDELEDGSSEDEDTEIDDSDQGKDEEESTGEDPLNSSDDVSEEDTAALFETDNVIACQYNKVVRHKNHWKLYLKNGIMNLEGEDYVFSKLTGDAFW